MANILMILLYGSVFLFGITVGSFLNVCIYRIPGQETVVTIPSHCMSCGVRLKWYDLIPVVSYLALHGRCRSCGSKLSLQYPLVEAGNGLLWVITFLLGGVNRSSVLSCLAISALLVISVIDARTFEIPFGLNVFLFLLGGISTVLDRQHWVSHLTGLLFIAAFLLLIYQLTGGRGIGGGDIKLMAASGLLLGFAGNIVAFFFGCLYASVIHLLRMKFQGAKSMLAMGPYLSAGIVTALWFGTEIAEWYLQFFL